MAIAAAATQVHPSPPPPPARRTVAGLACTRLAWTAAVHVVTCLFLANLWLFFWGLAAMDIGRFACGWGCAVVNVAYKVFFVAAVTLVTVVSCTLLLAWMMDRARATAAVPGAAAATDTEATKVQEPALKTSDVAMLVRRALSEPIALGVLASVAFGLLMVVGVVVVSVGDVMGSRRQRMGSVIYYVGALGLHTVDCFVLFPLITVSVWRSGRKEFCDLLCR